jgi:hypothetical protein
MNMSIELILGLLIFANTIVIIAVLAVIIFVLVRMGMETPSLPTSRRALSNSPKSLTSNPGCWNISEENHQEDEDGSIGRRYR